MRIIFLPLNIAGTSSSLSKALRGRGLRAETWVYAKDWLQFRADKFFARANLDGGLYDRMKIEISKFRMLGYLWRTDVVVYCFGATVFYPARGYFRWWTIAPWLLYNLYSLTLQLIELSLAQAFGLKIAVIFQGNDARRRRFATENFEIHFAAQAKKTYSVLGDLVKRYQAFLFGIVADRIFFMNPDLGYILPGKASFMPYPSVFPEEVLPVGVSTESGPLIIGHAPTSRSVKGTHLVQEAVSNLQARGVAIELVLIENVPHEEALKLYRGIDVFVDQLFAGWYGAVAVELMALGKPVIAYIRSADLSFVDPEMTGELPLINCEPSDLEQLLSKFAALERGELAKIGWDSRLFVERWHDPNKIALDLLSW